MYANFNFNFTSILILAHVTGSAQRKSKTLGKEYLLHLALIIAATGMGLRVLNVHCSLWIYLACHP